LIRHSSFVIRIFFAEVRPIALTRARLFGFLANADAVHLRSLIYDPAMSRPVLVLLPGMHGTDRLFGPFLAVLPVEQRRRVVSYPTDQSLSYIQLLARVEEELVDESEIVLIAESFGGPLAIIFAAAHPDRVRGVVLCATFALPPFPSWLRWFAGPAVFRLPIHPATVRLLMAGPNATDSQVEQIRHAVTEPLSEVMAHRARSALTVDCTQRLKDCAMPVLYLAPNQDRLLRPSDLSRILSIRPDVTVHRLDGPHLILQMQPAAAWEAISTFLGRLRVGNS
jgi:pimeloyl-ACP methyl ester carboxylesterase